VLAERCSTGWNVNCQQYVADCVFVQQQAKSSDHWMPTLPEHDGILMAACTT